MAREILLEHPGAISQKEWLNPMGISQYALAKGIDVPTHAQPFTSTCADF